MTIMTKTETLKKYRAAVIANAVLAAKVGHQVRGIACPECGDVGPHDSNGDRQDPTMCCCKCGMLTDADNFEVAQ